MTSQAAAAVEKGIAFLHRAQLESGEIPVSTCLRRDMDGPCTPDPSVFPTALAAQALAHVPGTEALRARALAFLAAQRGRDGLWRHWTRDHSHFRQLPPDLDDSSCASAALAAAGMAGASDPDLLLANRDGGGLFYTWVTPRLRWHGLRHAGVAWPQLRHAATLFGFFKATSAAPGDVDAVVNANCLFHLGAYPGHEAVTGFLLDILRRRAERACDKWYDNPIVIHYFFARALSPVAPEARDTMLDRLAAMQAETALEAALSLSARLCWDDAPEAEAVERLIAQQSADGSWPRAALYSGGRERRRDGSFAPAHPDTPHWGSEGLTTALALEALGRWLRAERR